MKKHLLALEKNLPDIMLKSFRDTEVTGVRNANTENNSLFQYWLEVKKAVGGKIVINYYPAFN